MSLEFRRLLIMLAGVASTATTLVLVATTSASDLLYTYHRIIFLLPTGAFALGVLAGSGYGIAGWFLTRLHFTPAMLKAIVVSMVVAYFGTALVEYGQNAPEGMGFIEYFDLSSRTSAWETQADPSAAEGEEPEAFGTQGYTYRLLELLGLTLGGMGGLFVIPALINLRDSR